MVAEMKPNEINYEDAVANFLLRLREEKKTSSAACEYVVEEMSCLLEVQGQVQVEKLREIWKDSFVDAEDTHSMTMFERSLPGNELKTALEKFRFKAQLDRYVASKEWYVAPEENVLGTADGKTHTMQYVPILRTLNVLLQKEDIVKYVLDPVVPSKRITEFRDGAVYSANALFSQDPTALQIILYHDDFTPVNPLGNKVTEYKVTTFYFTLGNLPRKKRSSLKSIHLVALCWAKDVALYGYNAVLRPLINDLQQLEVQGVRFFFDGLEHTVYGTISKMVGDNLGQHAIGGFPQSFSTTLRACRYCMCLRSEMCDHYTDEKMIKRTASMHDEHLRCIEENEELSQVYGIKGYSVLDELTYYSSIGQTPFDISHDILEGLAVEVMTCVTRYFLRNNYFTLEYMNNRLKNFEYAAVDMSDKPQPVKAGKSWAAFKVKQNAAEMGNLIRLYPIMFGDVIPESDKVWDIVIEFAGLLEVVSAQSFVGGDVIYMQTKIGNFLDLFFTQFKDTNIKPKGHFFTHYPSQTLELGPPCDHNTIRFEGKHNYFKEIYNRSKNRINILKTLAERHQCLMYLTYKEEYVVDHPYIISASSEMPVMLMDRRIKDKIAAVADVNVVSQVTSINFNGQKYSNGTCIVLGHVDDMPLFGKVECVIFIHKLPYLIIVKLETMAFNPHYNAYEVTDLGVLDMINPEDLADYHSLGFYNVSNVDFTLIPLKHVILYE